MAAITRKVASSAPVSTRSAAIRVKPFTSAVRGQRPSLRQSRQVLVRAEEEEVVETPSAPEEVDTTTEAVADDDDFNFNLRDARSANEYQPSDVEAAIRYFEEGSGDMPYEGDHVTNITGVEDAAFFDDIDNNEGYEADEYASAGISEAAPKNKRRGKRGEEAVDESGMSDEMKALEEERLQAAAFDELDLDEDDLYGDYDAKDAPWVWEEAAGEQEEDTFARKPRFGALASLNAAQAEEDDIIASLAGIDLTQAEMSEDDKERLTLVTEAQELDVDALDADEVEEEFAEDDAEALTQAEEAAIDALLAEELEEVADFTVEGAALPAVDGDEEVVALDDAEVEAYIKALQALQSSDAGVPVEQLGAIMSGEGGEAPVVVGADEEVPELGAVPEFKLAPELLQEDAAFEAALNADEAGDVEGLVADLAELSAIPAVEYSAAMFPEDADLELFENLLDATQNYMELAPEEVTGELVTSDGAAWYDDVNMYEDLPEDLVARASTLAAAEDEEEERDMASFAERVLELSRVTKVVKGGKIMGFRAVVVIGDMKGRVGVGCESGREVQTAVKRALVDARKNIVRVPLVRAGTIPHRIETWFKGAGVVIVPAVEGTGVIAGSSVRSVLELAGVKNVLAKRLGSRSQLNNARVTLKALSELRTLDDVARARGLPLQYLLQ